MAQFKVIKQVVYIVDLFGITTTEEATRELRKGSDHLTQKDMVSEDITGVELVGDSEHEN